MNITNHVILFIISTILFTSCGTVASFFDDKIDEGYVEYDIVYLQSERENPLISLLPTTMTFKFKNNTSIQKIEGWMGIFSMSGIANRKLNKTAALLKLMGDRYLFESTMDGPAFGFDPMPGMIFEFTDSSKVIAGMNSNMIKVRFKNDSLPEFNIFYTDMISLDNPNSHNPFSEINGVLLEYYMTFQKIPMKLTAKKIVEESISEEEFKVPSGYEKVSLERMQEVIGNLM